MLESLGVKESKKLFMWIPKGMYSNFPDGKKDNTHFTEYGALKIAKLVTQGIYELDLKLCEHLKKAPFKEKFAFQLPIILKPEFKKDTFNIVDYGAKADGRMLNSLAISKAIDACHQSGGGTVLIPKGLWLTGSIALKNNVNLHIQKGAVLQFSDNFDHYPLIETNWEGMDAIRCQSPIYGMELENIAITGKGILDGSGDAWRPVKKSKLTAAQWQELIDKGGVIDDQTNIWYPSQKPGKPLIRQTWSYC